MPNTSSSPPSVPDFLRPDPEWQEAKRRLWAMTPDRRVQAMRRGELSLRLCLHWAAIAPAEVPSVNGEWEFIAAYTPDVAELDPHVAQRERAVESLVRQPDAAERSQPRCSRAR